jgi:hypothetical protein
LYKNLDSNSPRPIPAKSNTFQATPRGDKIKIESTLVLSLGELMNTLNKLWLITSLYMGDFRWLAGLFLLALTVMLDSFVVNRKN